MHQFFKFSKVIFLIISIILTDQIFAAKGMGLAKARAEIAKELPDEDIKVKINGKELTLLGNSSSEESIDKAIKILKKIFPNYVIKNHISQSASLVKKSDNKNNNKALATSSSNQVMLRVKIGEVEKIGENFDPKSNKFNMTRVFAEPVLVAMSGSSAFFQSGGEIPIKSRSGTDYKPYGVKVSFSPTIIPKGKIRMDIYSEISEAVKSNRNDKESEFHSRKVKTTVELSPGESFMIAGLVKDIFSYGLKSNSELVISVTPYLVNSVESSTIKLPTDKYYKKSNMELKFLDNLNKNLGLSNEDSQNLSEPQGPAGLITE